MKKVFCNRLLYLFLFFFIFANLVAAQEEEKLVEKWIQKDIKATKIILRLSQDLPQDENKIAEIIGSQVTHYPEELGFGAKKIQESQGYGYTSIRVSAFIFKNSIINYRITIEGSLSWSKVREQIINAWKQNTQLPFKEFENGIYYEIKNDSVLEEYKKAVARELGETKQVEVPNILEEHYYYLTSPMYNSTVGRDGCGVAGVTPAGNESIDLILKSKKIDLLENILRGFNPGGRVYAAIAFLELKKQGKKLKPDIEITLEKIINLDTKLDVCLGGVIFSKTAREILKEYKLL